jgi:hypothetical protein
MKDHKFLLKTLAAICPAGFLSKPSSRTRSKRILLSNGVFLPEKSLNQILLHDLFSIS